MVLGSCFPSRHFFENNMGGHFNTFQNIMVCGSHRRYLNTFCTLQIIQCLFTLSVDVEHHFQQYMEVVSFVGKGNQSFKYHIHIIIESRTY